MAGASEKNNGGNSGHIKKAVALEYKPGLQDAPQVVATGQGLVAENIVRLAKEYNIPVEEDPVLVDALRVLQLGEEIPPELYRVVAEILVFVMDLDKEARN
ncbi:EscU/YscU/HrcU family type III secretion system export apparatus switch protein [Thermincola ferriacetica]